VTWHGREAQEERRNDRRPTVATEIIAVRTEKPIGYSHAHITHVLTADRRTLSRAQVIAKIEGGWESFCTYALHTRADVIVRDCPSCGSSDYITTTPDWTTDNNLLQLPSF
jgi:hypothetical protein